MRSCSEHCVGSNGFNLKQGEFAALGHQVSGDTKFEYMRLKERARRKRSGRELRGKASKAREESV